MRKPWTDNEIKRAKKMRADGVSLYESDRYFDRPRNSTWQAIALRENAEYRKNQIMLKREWRATLSSADRGEP